MTATAAEPVRLLIAAMGGEGGGVLAGWIAEAAIAGGMRAQRTSIPGVAQRTGATTYYLEMVANDGRPRPVLALNPAPGQVDVLLATELLETVRMIEAGYVTPDRTLIVASTHRVYTVAEKMAMGDGRLPDERLFEVARRFSRSAILADLARLAAETGGQLNAVLLGALARTRAVPIEPEHFRAAIRAEGKAVESNLRCFETGFELAGAGEPKSSGAQSRGAAPSGGAGDGANLGLEIPDAVPAEARSVVADGIRRLIDFQDRACARRYLDRLMRFVGRAGADGPFIRELARHLAVRMSFEDVIRVAQLKLREARLARVRAEAGAGPGDIVDVTEFMKPGFEEILSLLPPAPARRLLGWVERRGWKDGSLPLKIRTTRPFGFVRLKLLAALKGWRPRTLRHADEEAWIERWLGLVERALAIDPEAASEVVETARLVKGYAETYARGRANWARIADEVIEAALHGALPRGHLADAVREARAAALRDPDGDALERALADVRGRAARRANAAE